MKTNKDISDIPTSDKISFQLLQNRIHYISGDIQEFNVEQAIKWIIYENLIGTNPDKILTLYINSDGGNISDAFALISVMKQSKCKIRTIGIGSIVSSAFLIFVSGTKGERYISENASIMCHQFSSSFEGKYHDIRSQMKENDMLNSKMEKLLCEASGLEPKTIKTKILNSSDVWLSPEELINYGFADHLFS